MSNSKTSSEPVSGASIEKKNCTVSLVLLMFDVLNGAGINVVLSHSCTFS